MAAEVYIGESSRELNEQLAVILQKKGYRTESFFDFKLLAENLTSRLPDVLLINHRIIDPKGMNDRWFKSLPVIVYANEMEMDERLSYYNRGVHRVIVDSRNLMSLVTATAGMLLYRMNELRSYRQKSLTYGTLQSFSLYKILQNALLEKKNFVIQLQYRNWKAKIRVFQGHIVSAVMNNLSGEEAALKALQLPAGTFLIRRYQKMEEFSPVSTSTFALLAESRFEKKEIRDFLDRFGISNPVFNVAPDYNASKLNDEELKLFEIIRQYHAFQEILLRSSYHPLKTVRLFSKLFKKSGIHLEGESESTETLNELDIEYIRDNLFPDGVREGKILVLGLPSSGKSLLIRTLAGLKEAKIKTVQSVDFTRIPLEQNLWLVIFGLSIEQNFQKIFDKLSEGMLACIFVVDYHQHDKFDYSKYLLQQVLQKYNVPVVIGVTNAPANFHEALRQVREQLLVPAGVEVISIKADSIGHIRQLFYNLKKIAEFTDRGSLNV